jgi:hypothetical protein
VVCNLDSRFHTVATALDAHDLYYQLSLIKITSLLLNEEARQDQDQAAPQANLAGQKRRSKVHLHLSHGRTMLHAASRSPSKQLETEMK